MSFVGQWKPKLNPLKKWVQNQKEQKENNFIPNNFNESQKHEHTGGSFGNPVQKEADADMILALSAKTRR